MFEAPDTTPLGRLHAAPMAVAALLVAYAGRETRGRSLRELEAGA